MSRTTKSRHRRGVMAVAGTAALGLLALTACSAAPESDEASDGSGTTTVTVMYASSEFSKDQVAAFEEANPDLKVNFIEFDQTRLNAMLTAGDPPDLVRGAPSANTFAKGLAEPLDAYIADSEVITEDDLLAVNDNWRWDGKKTGAGPRYGLVKDWSQDGMIWQNTQLMQGAGVEPLSTTEPVSWDELLDKGKQLQAGGITHGLGVEWQWGLVAPVFTMILQQDGTIYNDDLSEIDLTSPEAQKAVQWFVDFGTSGAGPTSLNPLPDGSDGSAFAASNMAMSMDGYWFGGSFQGEDTAAIRDSGVAMAPAPTFGTRVNASFNGGIGAWIPATAKHKDAGWRVMEYFIAGQPAIDRAKSGWGLPGLESLWTELPTEFPYQQQALETSKAELPYLVTLPDSPYVQASAMIQIFDTEITAAVKGDKTTAEACAEMEEQINDLIAQGKDQLG